MALSDADVTGRKLVIFDFDGTLANTVPSIVSTARTVLARHGLTEESMGDLKRLVGPPFPQAYEWVYGFSPEVTARANDKISLSKMTFSHEMVRLFFTEQLYRAMTIINNEPYHHD